jgi:hypothetical protein
VLHGKPFHSMTNPNLAPPWVDPPEPEPWQEAEAERASDDESFAPPEEFGESPHDFWGESLEDAGTTAMREQLADACAACIAQIVEGRSMLGLELTVLLQLSNRNKLEALNAFKLIDAAVKQLNHTLAQTRPGAERSVA